MPRDAVAILPSRLGSTRFPGKVLADATGWPLIRHVHDRASRAGSVARVVVAADDERIVDAVHAFGGEVVLTSADHPNGTSRLAEAAGRLGLPMDAIVVNVQGDEPEIDPAHIDACVGALRGSGAAMASVACDLPEGSDHADPNIVKVVLSGDSRAMYFSRAPIPYTRGGGSPSRPRRHLGLYAYRRGFLEVYAALPSTPLERTEMLEQLRALEHGHSIAMAVVSGSPPAGIDTPEQYADFVRRWNAARG